MNLSIILVCYHEIEWVKPQNLISHHSGAWEVQDQESLVLGESALPGLEMAVVLLGPYMAEMESSGVSSSAKDTSSIMGLLVSLSAANCVPKATSSRAITVRLGLQHVNFHGTQTFGPRPAMCPVDGREVQRSSGDSQMQGRNSTVYS